MTQVELLDFLQSHEYTDSEKEQACKIVDTVREQGVDCVGYYIYPNEKLRQDGLSFSSQHPVSVVAISDFDKINSFNYYIVEMYDNAIHITDFQEKHTEKWDENASSFQRILYCLLEVMGDLYGYSKKNSHYVLNNGYCVKATLTDNGKYRLTPIYGYASGMANDSVIQYGCHFMKPVFSKIECPSCHHTWMFDDSKIPDNEKYELFCKKCGTSLMRKKVIGQ